MHRIARAVRRAVNAFMDTLGRLRALGRRARVPNTHDRDRRPANEEKPGPLVTTNRHVGRVGVSYDRGRPPGKMWRPMPTAVSARWATS
jgi:hypothetical protein